MVAEFTYRNLLYRRGYETAPKRSVSDSDQPILKEALGKNVAIDKRDIQRLNHNIFDA